MNPLLNFQWFAAKAFDQLLFSLAEGGVLIVAISLLLRLLSKKNSRTRFAVWFSTLIAIAVLPLARSGWQPHVVNSGQAKALITIPSAWAAYLTLVWAVVAGAGLIRLAAGLWGLWRLRRGATEIDPCTLGPELHEVIKEFRHRRRVSILVSERAGVPGAIGFLRPAIILPVWLLEDPQGADVKYVVLHELAHLERWDDWTNLLQRVVKALMFFHPGVWWIERKLFLDREMACDDAVLARAASARSYAQCLARVAEKSFLQRQLALATAAVDRLSQLSRRLARVLDLDVDRPRVTRTWKPAVPMVAAVALLCAISVSRAPNLVQLSNSASTLATAGSPSPIQPLIQSQDGGPHPHILKAALRTNWKPPQSMTKIAKIASPAKRNLSDPGNSARSANLSREPAPRLAVANYEPEENADSLVLVVVSDQVIQQGSGQSDSQFLQIKVWEVRWFVPATRPTKSIPRRI